MRDLAPTIYRQRLVIEGIPRHPISAPEISTYLSNLSEVLGMQALIEPITHLSPTYGWAGWIHWETSGAHLYAWDEPQLFFSVDIYTCKHFEDDVAVEFTARAFDAEKIVSTRLPHADVSGLQLA